MFGPHSAGRARIAPQGHDYRSVDSAPAGVSKDRPRSVVDGFLLTFTAVTVLALCVITALRAQFGDALPADVIFFTADRANAVLPIRLFCIIFFATYAAHAYATPAHRLRLGLFLLGKFLMACALVDGMAFLSWGWASVIWPVYLQQLFCGLAALVVFPHTVLQLARLPVASGSPITRRAKFYEFAVIVGAGLIASIAALVAETVFGDRVRELRAIALLGGMGPGIFLAQQIFTIQLAAIGFVRNALGRRRAFAPTLAVLVPAHNESHQIRATIAGLDRAAGRYKGEVRVLIVDNCSTDDTAAMARASLRRAENLVGTVVACDTPGKAKALNFGLGILDEDYIVRIDADTIVGPRALAVALRHFANPDVGAVGGLPLPHYGTGWLGKVRSIEILVRHGFTNVALTAVNGVLGVPGMFVVYRKAALDSAGGIAEGMNGEDTDIVLRMTNLGYRAVSEPAVRFRTEVPHTLHHLREQRTRWFRSLYHITAHNRDMLFNQHLVTGAVVMPFTLMNGARRAMMTPLAIYGAVIFFLFGGLYHHPDFQTVVAVMVGMPFVMALFVCLMWGRFDLVPFLPFYMGFRLLRSYYTLAATLTLIYPALDQREFVARKPRQTPPGLPAAAQAAE